MLRIFLILFCFGYQTICYHFSDRKLVNHKFRLMEETSDENYSVNDEPMFSVSYDPLEFPNQLTYERDLEDKLLERSLRFYDKSMIRNKETCYLVGLEDYSSSRSSDHAMRYTLEESLTELSELAGAAGLTVVGSTYQRVSRPSIEYYIGQGKTKEIAKTLSKLKCTCVIFDTELTPSQQKNLELVLNQDQRETKIKVVDRTALILDIFAQHARTKEGQLQTQLALLTYRLPRLTNMWTHLERQSTSRGRTSGGVGLRGPGEKQLETDKRQMKLKISLLNCAIDAVRRHRSSHRKRRRQLGVPVVALVGYTNAGKSTLLNSFTQSNDVLASDMLFATLDPTTRLVRTTGMQFPDMLLTDTVGFIQKLPTNLVAAFRATLEEIAEADVLLHVSDITNAAWRKQECAVLEELTAMGLENKPIVRVWNKIDLIPDQKEYWKYEASKSSQTVAVSCITGEGMSELTVALQQAICNTMEDVALAIPYTHTSVLNTLHRLGSLQEVLYNDEGIFVRGKIPNFLVGYVNSITDTESETLAASDSETASYYYESELSAYSNQVNGELEDENSFDELKNQPLKSQSKDDEYFDWTDLAKGRHSATNKLYSLSKSVPVFTSASFSNKNHGNGSSQLWDKKFKRDITNKQQAHLSATKPSNSAQFQAELLRSICIKESKLSANKSSFVEENENELIEQGLISEGLLDFDSGEFGHHVE